MNAKTPVAVALSADDVKRGLAAMLPVIERRNTIPVLGTCRLTVGKGALTLRATDLDMEALRTFPVETDAAPLDLCLFPRALMAMARGAKTLTMAVEVGKGGQQIVSITDDADTHLRLNQIIPAADFPEMVDLVDAVEMDVPEAVLHRALSAAMPCVSHEETRYYLNGVYVHPINGKLRTVATDGHRLASYDTDLPWKAPGAIWPRKAVRLILAALRPNGDETIHVEAAALELRISGDGWAVTTKLIDGTFPDYTRVIPTRADDCAVVVNLAMLRRLAIAATGRSNAVAFDPGAGTAKVGGGSFDEHEVRVPCKVTAPDRRSFGFGIGYLRDFAASEADQTIRIEGKSPGDPFHVVGADPALTRVLMPMRV